MSTIQTKKTMALSAEIMERQGEVTIAANNGVVVHVESNDLIVALGVVFAANMASAHSFWSKEVKSFDIKMEIKAYSNNG